MQESETKVVQNTADQHLRRLLQWQRGEAQGPLKLTVFPTNICNIECKHCWQRWADYDKTYKSELSDERLLRLVDEAHELGVEEWYFVGGGDAMGRGKLVIDMCERIRALGMNGGIHTNGTLFKKGMFDRLIDMEWGYIRVSLDGPNAEINDHIRSRGFEKATRAIKDLSDLKKARGARYPTSGIYATLTNLTFDKVDQFVELAHELGCEDGVMISGLVVEGAESAQFELSAAQKAALPDNVRKAKARADELGVSTNFQAYLDEELVHDGMNMHRGYVYGGHGGMSDAMCFEPWMNMSVLPDGKVGPCCAWYDDSAMSLKENSLEVVWNGPYMTSVREGMRTGNPPSYCKRCPSNLYVQKEKMRAAFSPALAEGEHLQTAGAGGRLALFARKGLTSLRRHGFRRAVARGLEWRRIHGRM